MLQKAISRVLNQSHLPSSSLEESISATMVKILVIAASDGKNKELAELWCRVGSGKGYTMSIVDLCAANLPLYTPALDKEGRPEGVSELEAIFEQADAWIICAPEYNGAMPPTLNNSIAWLSTHGDDFRGLFNGRAVALSTHSGGGGNSVISVMRMQFSYLGCNVVGRALISNKNKEANPESMKFILEQLDKMS
ncbi:MAG: NADPH-dependent oxidoreductase [Euryarchaeota archaeon]|nr:NADPH-dependent oxidoreductase [Euryarchaeota archaeon]